MRQSVKVCFTHKSFEREREREMIMMMMVIMMVMIMMMIMMMTFNCVLDSNRSNFTTPVGKQYLSQISKSLTVWGFGK